MTKQWEIQFWRRTDRQTDGQTQAQVQVLSCALQLKIFIRSQKDTCSILSVKCVPLWAFCQLCWLFDFYSCMYTFRTPQNRSVNTNWCHQRPSTLSLPCLFTLTVSSVVSVTWRPIVNWGLPPTPGQVRDNLWIPTQQQVDHIIS